MKPEINENEFLVGVAWSMSCEEEVLDQVHFIYYF